MSVTALAPWFGSARMLAEHVGDALAGCRWVGIPFAGGCCEILRIDARTILVNDLHRHLINLARVVEHPETLADLQRRVSGLLCHPDTLAAAQNTCVAYELGLIPEGDGRDVEWAAAFFVVCWMTRSGEAGSRSEFTAKLSLRWDAAGGDGNQRFRSAIESLDTFHEAMRERCTFTTMDAFAFLERCRDRSDNGVYCDPPFFGPGAKYRHAPKSIEEQQRFHVRLADVLGAFTATRVVLRAYDVPLMRELYTPDRWRWINLPGRKQTNEVAPDVLIVGNASDA